MAAGRARACCCAACRAFSKKILTQTLREMEASGLITRHVEGTVPPAVEYRLTALGRRFVEPVEMLYAWGRDNADALDQLKTRPTSRRAD